MPRVVHQNFQIVPLELRLNEAGFYSTCSFLVKGVGTVHELNIHTCLFSKFLLMTVALPHCFSMNTRISFLMYTLTSTHPHGKTTPIFIKQV